MSIQGVGTRRRIKNNSGVELHYDHVMKRYTVMPDRYDPLNWEEYDEDEKAAALERYEELVRKAQGLIQSTSYQRH
jgi:hypothetical protein